MWDDKTLQAFYANLLVGRLPVGDGDPVDVVMHQVYALVGTKQLHLHLHVQDGHVIYLAIESRHLTSLPQLPVPFTAVLPGTAAHQGDGLYVLEGQSFTAALLCEGGSVSFVCNQPEVIQEFYYGLGYPLHKVQADQGTPLRSVPQTILGFTKKASKWLTACSLSLAALGITAFVGAHAGQVVLKARQDEQLNPRGIEDSLNKELDKLNVQQPLARQIARIQKVSATVVRAGGWMESYALKGEQQESFEIVLPSWVSPDYLDALGRDVVTDLRDLEGLLTVRKKAKDKS